MKSSSEYKYNLSRVIKTYWLHLFTAIISSQLIKSELKAQVSEGSLLEHLETKSELETHSSYNSSSEASLQVCAGERLHQQELSASQSPVNTPS